MIEGGDRMKNIIERLEEQIRECNYCKEKVVCQWRYCLIPSDTDRSFCVHSIRNIKV